MKLSFKKFIEVSKWLTKYKDKTFFYKLKFYIESPFRFKLFKKEYKAKLEKKEIR